MYKFNTFIKIVRKIQELSFIKKILCVFLFLCLCGILCGCKRVKESSVDELTVVDWYIENPSGISASLEFSDNEAVFIIFDKGEQVAEISGVYSADKNSLFITSEKYSKTFTFEYKAFGDRCEISYGGECLVFYPKKDATADEIYAQE